jgi:predicted nucleotidyltransferase
VVTYEIGEDASGLVASLRDMFDTEAVRYRGSIQNLAQQVPEAISIVLFGSEARLEPNPGSDTDLLVIMPEHTEAVDERVRAACLEVASKYSLALSWLVMSVAELRELEETGNEFWSNILREGIRLHGKTLEALQQSWQRGKTTSRSLGGSGKRPRPSTTRNISTRG